MAINEKLIVQIGSDTRDFDSGLKKVKSGVAGLKNEATAASSGLNGMSKSLTSFTKAGLVIAGITAGLKAASESMKVFISYESSVNRITELFGNASKNIVSFAEGTGKLYGMSESAIYEYAAIYGNLFKNITSSTQENSAVTIEMLKASAVVASKTGRTMEDVMDRIRSGLLGNTEAIEDLGINVNVAMLEITDAFKKIANGRSWEQLTFYEQQQIRTLAILEQAHKNFGDSVQKKSAFSISALSGSIKDLTISIGQFVNAGLQPLIKGFTLLVQWVTNGVKALAALVGLKPVAENTRSQIKNTEKQTVAQNELNESIKETVKARQRLAGFDELNILSRGTKDNSASSSNVNPFASFTPTVESIDTSGVQETVDKLKKMFNFKNLETSWNNFIKKLKPIPQSFLDNAKWFYDEILVPFGKYTIEDFIPAFLDAVAGGLELVYTWGNKAKPVIKWLWDNLLSPIAEIIGDGIVILLQNIADLLSACADIINGDFSDAWSHFRNILDRGANAWRERFADLKERGKDAFESVKTFLKQSLDNFSEYVGKIIDKAIVAIHDFSENVAKTFAAVKDRLREWKDNTIYWIKREIPELLDRIIDIFKSLPKRLYNVGVDMINGLISGINSGIDFVERFVNKVIDGINSVTGTVGIKIDRVSWGRLDYIPPKFASGGLAYGEVLSVVGDNFNARQDPEVISPLSVLKNMIIESLQSSAPQYAYAPGDIYIQIGEEQLDGIITRSERSRSIKSNGR